MSGTAAEAEAVADVARVADAVAAVDAAGSDDIAGGEKGGAEDGIMGARWARGADAVRQSGRGCRVRKDCLCAAKSLVVYVLHMYNEDLRQGAGYCKAAFLMRILI